MDLSFRPGVHPSGEATGPRLREKSAASGCHRVRWSWGVLAELVGVPGHGVDTSGEVGVLGTQVGPSAGQGLDEAGGVVAGEGRVQLVDRRPGVGGQPGEQGDLTGQAAQVGRVVAGPGGDGAVGGA
ncbi:hypothetical protein ACFQ9Q_25010 [Streptomyces virginiae]|uniref:hypothetical protein n=1 Tax=Streptomyces virginiae TaxID=1961 RepID=UPI0036AD1DCB